MCLIKEKGRLYGPPRRVFFAVVVVMAHSARAVGINLDVLIKNLFALKGEIDLRQIEQTVDDGVHGVYLLHLMYLLYTHEG